MQIAKVIIATDSQIRAIKNNSKYELQIGFCLRQDFNKQSS